MSSNDFNDKLVKVLNDLSAEAKKRVDVCDKLLDKIPTKIDSINPAIPFLGFALEALKGIYATYPELCEIIYAIRKNDVTKLAEIEAMIEKNATKGEKFYRHLESKWNSEIKEADEKNE